MSGLFSGNHSGNTRQNAAITDKASGVKGSAAEPGGMAGLQLPTSLRKAGERNTYIAITASHEQLVLAGTASRNVISVNGEKNYGLIILSGPDDVYIGNGLQEGLRVFAAGEGSNTAVFHGYETDYTLSSGEDEFGQYSRVIRRTENGNTSQAATSVGEKLYGFRQITFTA